MEFLQNHADRAVARHMLAIGAVVVAVACVWFVGAEFIAAANDLGANLGQMEIGQ